MKKLLTTLFAMSLFITTQAQTIVPDSVTMGAGYANEIFYKLDNLTGVVGQAPNNSWDIGFESFLMGASIIVNHAKGIIVYKAPDTAWASLDTMGLNTWRTLYNKDTSWEKGALNVTANAADIFDFGWGNYNFSTYNVDGDDSAFVLQSGPPGGPYAYKKLKIMHKLGIANAYVFRIANLDNTSDVTDTLHESAFSTRNFAYYDMTKDSVLDLEPDNGFWDIVFTRYVTYLNPPGIYYPVTGVFSNKGVTVAEARGVNLPNASYSNFSGALSTDLSEIGYDWATYNFGTNSYDIEDSLSYFIKALNGDIYKLWFTKDEGSATGKIVFDMQDISLNASTIDGTVTSAAVYPNPSSSQFNLIYSTDKVSETTMQVFDMTGRNVLNEKLNVKQGLNVIPVSLNNLTAGSYIVKVAQGNNVVNLKMMVTK